MSCCSILQNGRPRSSGSPTSNAQIGSDEIDFRAQTLGNVNTAGNNNYTTIGGVALGWTGRNTGAGANNFDIVAGGLRCVLNAANTSWTEAIQTGPAIWISLGSLYTAYASQGLDASCDIIFRIYASTINFVANPAAPAGMHLAIWGVAGSPSNSGNRYAAAARAIAGGPSVPVVFQREGGTTGSNYTNAPVDTSNVFGLNLAGGNVQILAGVWGGAWSPSSTPLIAEAGVADGTSTSNSSYRDQLNRLAITFSTGNVANNNSTLVVERIRWDWRRPTSLAA